MNVKYWIWFSRIEKLNSLQKGILLEKFKSPKKIWNLEEKDLRKLDGINEKWCYIYFNIATSITSEKLFENSLILAEQCGIDYYIGNSINNYENILKKYKFNSNIEDEDSYGSLKYYFNNFICPETEGKDISIILI